MGIRRQIASVVKEIDRSYGRKPIKLDWKTRNEEYAKTKTGVKAQRFYNAMKMSNSYAEAKQHNLI